MDKLEWESSRRGRRRRGEMRNVKVTTVVTPSLVTQKVIKHFSLPTPHHHTS
jgi:hypothetical protein